MVTLILHIALDFILLVTAITFLIMYINMRDICKDQKKSMKMAVNDIYKGSYKTAIKILKTSYKKLK